MGRTVRILPSAGPEGSGGGNRMGRTGRRLECRERVRWGEQDGEDRKEVRVPGEGSGDLTQGGEERKEVRVLGDQVGEQDGEAQEGG